ncbi:MAG: hypothetical protein HC906_12800 [Bacteroidales bacterium]|nr:hypothetical protein [Bacteroidales bacterium]
MDRSTIAAVSTPPGVGALAVLRLSGDDAFAIADKIFKSPSHKKLSLQKPNTLHFGTINDGEKIIDEVIVSLFKAPHSYTGENSIEISCHGSVYIQQKILELLITSGARLAKTGRVYAKGRS